MIHPIDKYKHSFAEPQKTHTCKPWSTAGQGVHSTPESQYAAVHRPTVLARPYKTHCRLLPPGYSPIQTTTDWLPVPLRTRHCALCPVFAEAMKLEEEQDEREELNKKRRERGEMGPDLGSNEHHAMLHKHKYVQRVPPRHAQQTQVVPRHAQQTQVRTTSIHHTMLNKHKYIQRVPRHA